MLRAGIEKRFGILWFGTGFENFLMIKNDCAITTRRKIPGASLFVAVIIHKTLPVFNELLKFQTRDLMNMNGKYATRIAI